MGDPRGVTIHQGCTSRGGHKSSPISADLQGVTYEIPYLGKHPILYGVPPKNKGPTIWGTLDDQNTHLLEEFEANKALIRGQPHRVSITGSFYLYNVCILNPS